MDKVGPKTAANGCTSTGSLDGLVANAHAIKGAVGENLRKRCHGLRQHASWSRSATTASWGRSSNRSNRWPAQPQDTERLRELYERYEFKVWLREIDNTTVANALNGGAVNGEPPPTQARPDVEYETVLSYEQLEAWLTKIGSADLTSIDTETTSLDPIAAELIGLSLPPNPARVLHPLASLYRGPKQLAAGRRARAASTVARKPASTLGHNMKYQMHAFANRGIWLAGIAHDVRLQSYVLDAHRNHDVEFAERHWAQDADLRRGLRQGR